MRSLEEISAQLKATPYYAPWPDPQAAISSLREMLRQERERANLLQEHLSSARSQVVALERASRAVRP